MKKLIFFVVVFGMFAGFVSAQSKTNLDGAISNIIDSFAQRFDKNDTVAIINIEAPTKELSDYIIEELTIGFINLRINMMQRKELETKAIEKELRFNTSVYISEESAVRIGQAAGAKTIITGSFSSFGDDYRLRVQATTVEARKIVAAKTETIKENRRLNDLLGDNNPKNNWKHQWIYVGFNVGYSAEIESWESSGHFERRYDSNSHSWYDEYYPDYEMFSDIPFGFSLYAIIQPFDLFGIAIDFGGSMTGGANIGIAPTLTIRPSSFEIDLFLGTGIDIFVDNEISIFGGVRAGYKVGPGVLYAEVRPMVWITENFMPFYVNLCMGYQMGFLPRK